MTGQQSAAVELGAGWFGSGLSPHAVARLAECCASVRTFGTDEVILQEGANTETFSIVLEGRVALRLLVPERGAVTVMTVEPGDVVGWSALVPPYRATSTAVAVEPTRIARLRERAAPQGPAGGPRAGRDGLPPRARGGGAPAWGDSPSAP